MDTSERPQHPTDGREAGAALFSPLVLRGRRLRNRIVISPMSQFSAQGRDGHATDWHLVHLGRFAQGGAALVFTESTAISPEGRISHTDLGIWSDDHVAGLRRITDFVRSQGALPGIQISHAGRRGATQAPWDGKGPLTAADGPRGEPPWPLIGPSAVAAREGAQTPVPMSPATIASVQQEYAAAAARADRAGFEALEVHAAHGYLIHSFLSPLSNRRNDGYGGDLQGRMRFGLETLALVRAAWPADKPLFVRLSCVDGEADGWRIEDSVAFAREMRRLGVDVVDCSSGGIGGASSHAPRIARRAGYNVPFAERIRAEAGIATMAVGLIMDAPTADAVVAGGRADLVAIGRAALDDPFWPHHAAQALGRDPRFEAWPVQYGYWLDIRRGILETLETD